MCVRIFWVSVSEHLVGIGTVPNLQRRSESQWKEVGKEGGGKKGNTKGKVNGKKD